MAPPAALPRIWIITNPEHPDGPVAPDFPRVLPNCQGLARFIYFQTRDFMRRVSHHVSIGTAYKNEQALNVYFILCRED